MVCTNAANPPAWACNGGTSPVPAPSGPANPPATTPATSPATTPAPPTTTPATSPVTTTAPPPTGNPPSDSGVEYYLLVEYDYFAFETEVSVVSVSTGETIAVFERDPLNEPYAFQETMLQLVPGEEYELIVNDSEGDGMPSGFAAVDVFVDGEWYDELAFVDGYDFDYSASALFTVPSNVRKSKKSPGHTKMSKTKNFCRDSGDVFVINGVAENCKWLELYWPKSASYCDMTDVALACPATCGLCDKIVKQDYLL